MEQSLSAYKLFYTVANTGNISYAAKELYISQPAISKGLRKLEESLGVALFHRTSRGVTLTPEGQILYEHVKTAFDTLHEAEEHIRMVNEFGMGQLHIGVSSTLCKYALLPRLNEFLSSHPHIQVTISCQSSKQTIELLEQGKIDIGLIGTTAPPKAFRYHSLGQIHDIFVARKSYMDNLKLRDSASIDDWYQKATFMMLDKNNLTRQYIDSYFTEHNITLGHMLEVTTMDLLIDFAKVGLGIACVIREFVQEELDSGELIPVPVNIQIPHRQIGFIYKKESRNQMENPALEEFKKGLL